MGGRACYLLIKKFVISLRSDQLGSLAVRPQQEDETKVEKARKFVFERKVSYELSELVLSKGVLKSAIRWLRIAKTLS